MVLRHHWLSVHTHSEHGTCRSRALLTSRLISSAIPHIAPPHNRRSHRLSLHIYPKAESCFLIQTINLGGLKNGKSEKENRCAVSAIRIPTPLCLCSISVFLDLVGRISWKTNKPQACSNSPLGIALKSHQSTEPL